MKKFTLIAILAATGWLEATAQHEFDAWKMENINQNAVIHTGNGMVRNSAVKNNDSHKPVYRILKYDIYFYNNGDWMKFGSANYEYDTSGRTAKMTTIKQDGILLNQITYLYEDNSITNINKVYDNETNELKNNSKSVIKYDSYDKSIITDDKYYVWDSKTQDWKIQESTVLTIERDENNNITSATNDVAGVITSSLTKTDTKYDTNTKLATEQTCLHSEGGEWITDKIFKDLTWQDSDGQIVKAADECFKGKNRIKSLSVYNGKGEKTGELNVEYTKKGYPDYTATRTEDNIVRYKRELASTDDYGSYTVYEKSYYSDLNGDGIINEQDSKGGMQTRKYDKYGYNTLEELCSIAGSKKTITWGARTTVAYSDKHEGVPSEIVYEYYKTKTDNNGQIISEGYEFSSRYVVTEVADITAGIGTNTTADNTPAAIYNLHGVKIGTGTEGLGKGIYIRKQGNKTTKITVGR